MRTNREDTWSKEDDKYLGEVVIRCISEGSTQLAAFEEAGEKLGRTSAACGFRFNTYVRKGIQEEINKAKKERLILKKRKAVNKTSEKSVGVTEDLDTDLEFLPQSETEGKVEEIENKTVTLESVMKDIQTLIGNNNTFSEGEREELLRENMMLKSENAELKAKLTEVSNMFNMLKGLNL